jgi:YidC/Oxa1 family membrane protein insertase
MLDPLYQAIGWLLSVFYGLVPNMGVAIVLLTFTVMLLLFPLTAKQAKSMLEMQQLQPEIKKLQAKHKGDRQKLNEEMMKLYQEHKVNPLGGCLPLLAQFPVFIALFQVLRTTYKHVPTDSKLFQDLCGSFETVNQCGDAKGFPRHLEFLSMDLSVTPLNAEGGFLTVLPYFVLVGLIVGTGLVQARQTRRTTPPGSNPQMLMIGRILPVVFGVISLNFPAGLCVYFLVSNAWRLGQQEVIFHKIHLPHRERMAAKGDARPKAKSTPAESKELPAGKAEEPPAEPVSTAARKQQPAPRPAPEPRPLSGGLRALFRLPPAPDGRIEAASPTHLAAAEAPPAESSPPGPQARPSSSRAAPGRRRNRKKRKR